MEYTITKITDESVTFTNVEGNDIILPQRAIDPFAYLNIGNRYDMVTEEVPYCISRARRQDIRDHHAEEALCGNI